MPGAWEILQRERNRVMVGILSPPDLKVSLNWARAYREMQLPLGSLIFDIRGLPWDAARNQLLKKAHDEGYGRLAFLDADVIAPSDWVMRLIATGHDLVGALYHRRFAPYHPAAGTVVRNTKGELVIGPLPPFTPGDVIPVDLLPSGATLISYRCMEAMLKTFPRPYTWAALDIAPYF